MERKQEPKEHTPLPQREEHLIALLSHGLRGEVHAIHSLLREVLHRWTVLSDNQRKHHVEQAVLSLESTSIELSGLLHWLGTALTQPQSHERHHAANELLLDQLTFWHPIAEARGIAIRESAHSSSTVRIDDRLFRLVFQNLLSNAVKHSAAGDVIELYCTDLPDKGMVEFGVVDQGAGVSEHIAASLFSSPMAEGESETAGMGFGLYLAARICKEKGLTIRYERLTKGAKFVLELAASTPTESHRPE